MRKAIFIATALAAAALMVAACGKKAVEGPTMEELKAEIAGVTAGLNAYLDAHSFSNTDAGTLTDELKKLASKYGELEKRAHEMRTQGGDERYGDVGNLAGEGRAKVEALALVLEAGAPMGDAAKATALNDVIENWADYSDKVVAAPGEAAPAEGEEPGVAEPTEPGVGEPGEPGVDEPGEPRYPGKGRHLGWWKNPEWARDRGTRPLTEGDVPGGREKEREREKERKRDATGAGPEREREREREHVAPGGGKGAGPGGETPGGAGGAGKGGGGKGKGKGADKGSGGGQ